MKHSPLHYFVKEKVNKLQ